MMENYQNYSHIIGSILCCEISRHQTIQSIANYICCRLFGIYILSNHINEALTVIGIPIPNSITSNHNKLILLRSLNLNNIRATDDHLLIKRQIFILFERKGAKAPWNIKPSINPAVHHWPSSAYYALLLFGIVRLVIIRWEIDGCPTPAKGRVGVPNVCYKISGWSD